MGPRGQAGVRAGDTTWPHRLELMNERLADLTPDQQYEIRRGNAERRFHFTPVEPTL